MARYEIICVTMTDGGKTHEHIYSVGVRSGQKFTVVDVINRINRGTDTFFVRDSSGAGVAEVGVVTPNAGRPYIRTHANGKWTDNLLSLPSC